MGKTSLDKPERIDWVKAAIYERKAAKKLEWSQIAEKAHCDADYLRKLISTKHTDDWNPAIRRSVCRALGISFKTILSVTEDNEVELH